MQELNPQIQAKGEEIFRRMEEQGRGSIFNKDWWYGQVMDWSMKNDQFKTQMFRFVDVLPTIQSNNELMRHLKEYFSSDNGELPAIFSKSLGIGSLMPGLVAKAVRSNVTQMAKMFITGETPQEALPIVKKQRKAGVAFTVDLLGEATLSEKEADEYQSRYLELIRWLAHDAKDWPTYEQLDQDGLGEIPKVSVSVKLTALYSQIKDQAWDDTKKVLKSKLRPIFREGIEKNAFIYLDMEHYGVKHLTLEVFEEMIMEEEFASYPHWGCVIQAYLRDSYKDIEFLVELAKKRKSPFSVRLVKGAYWDYEVIHAEQQGWPTPVYTNKAESDANYERCAKLLLDNYPHIKAAFASHNVRSLSMALTYAEAKGLPKNAFEIQMLYGMADPIKKTFVEMGYRVREYATVGELIPGMAYLVRRLLENTSNESFLRHKFAEGFSTADLLKDPAENLEATSALREGDGLFKNNPLKDWAINEHRQAMQQSLEKVRTQLGAEIYPIINGKELKSKNQFTRENPSHQNETIAVVHAADIEMADEAVDIAHRAFPAWKKTPVADRIALLERVADLFERDRYDIMALQVFETGKPWDQADGDLGEAIDFCRYYARDMAQISKALRVGSVPAEVSKYSYHARGVSLVIAPWNFPLAILTGMTAASLVTGNTVIVKPAEQSSFVAAKMMDIFLEAGAPKEVIHFLPGFGEEIGAHLVKHKHIANIAFTGSKVVGLQILQEAQRVVPGQQHVKRCVIEMGGKNALIIDADADLDEAVAGTLYSAFGFSGQKCSACSRVIVLDEVYDRFIERLVEGAKSIKIGAAEDPTIYLGPVIDKEAYLRIQATIAKAKEQHKLLFEGDAPTGGYYIAPTIFSEVGPEDELAHIEIFGPVLAVMRAKDIDEAIEFANNTEYALTGGVFSRSPGNIDKVRNNLEVGNMYINRGITGAYVDRHPFGGFKMSGVGSKTGGPDYLKQFMEPRVIIENTLRRGFAPSEDE